MSADGTPGRAHLFVYRERERDDGSTAPAFWIYGLNPAGKTEIWFGPFIDMRWTHQIKDRNYWSDKVKEKLGKGYVRAGEVAFGEIGEVLDATKSCLSERPQAIRPALGEHVRKFLEPSGMLTPQRRDRLKRMTDLGGLRPTQRRPVTGPVIAVSVSSPIEMPDDTDVQVF